MKKRHGIDELSIGLVWFAIGLMLINYFAKIEFLQALPLAIVFYAIFRTISTNEIKRNSENYIFKLKFLNPIQKNMEKLKGKYLEIKNISILGVNLVDKNYVFLKAKEK